jgi:hypothetical protein
MIAGRTPKIKVTCRIINQLQLPKKPCTDIRWNFFTPLVLYKEILKPIISKTFNHSNSITHMVTLSRPIYRIINHMITFGYLIQANFYLIGENKCGGSGGVMPGIDLNRSSDLEEVMNEP